MDLALVTGTQDSNMYTQIKGFSDLTIFHRGPSKEAGPLPSLFYFATTGQESLELDPFNQPVTFLESPHTRIFSCHIPGHGELLKNEEALSLWAQEVGKDQNPLSPFIESCMRNLDFLINEGWVEPSFIAVAGLSRGAFVATHLAAHDLRIQHVLGFAPLTQLSTLQEFGSLNTNPLVNALNLETLIPKLMHCYTKFYIGNRDTRVGTANCYHFIQQLTEKHYQDGTHTPPVELMIYPSVGHRGHGTPPYIFRDGINWLKKKWGLDV